MHNSNIPEDRELPSSERLLKSTVIALISAIILLITVVMPAEYGIDPTGMGNVLGLKRMGDIKVSLAAEVAADEASHATAAAVEESHEHGPDTHTHDDEPTVIAAPEDSHAHSPNTHSHEEEAVQAVENEESHEHGPDTHRHNASSHEMTVILAPNEGKEIKVVLAKDKTVNYSWLTNGGAATYDIHGDSADLGIDYHNYEKGSKAGSEGMITAAFDGKHGWFWRNRTDKQMIVTLKTVGEYTDIMEIK